VPAAHGCTTQLWRLAAGVRGRLPAPIPLAPELHGRVYALATSARVQVVAYAITGCAKGQPGFIGVVHPASRRVRQWGSVSVAGLSPGRVAIPASPCRPTGA